MRKGRDALTRAQRIVVKIGSRVLASDPDLVSRLAAEVASFGGSDKSFVIVSSGAIALGCAQLGYKKRPKEMARLQAAAAAGQSILMHRYCEAMATSNRTAAQVLLTHADLSDRERLNNARQALAALLEAGAVPVINENDTVATDEIRFGDNDQLAAMVVPLLAADALLLLTDVEGVLDASGARIAVLTADTVIGKRKSTREAVGSGGISSKLDAAKKASRFGASVVIAPAARPHVIADVLAGRDVGTLLLPDKSTLRARQHWIAFTLRPRGAILVDDGAAAALRAGRSSLLPVGVLGVRGDFHIGDAVRLLAPNGDEVGRGLTRLSALDVSRSAGKKKQELELLFGAGSRDLVVIHRDDLVVVS